MNEKVEQKYVCEADGNGNGEVIVRGKRGKR